MTSPATILWSEGLFLRPQHFQRPDRYREARRHATALTAQPMLWGVPRRVKVASAVPVRPDTYYFAFGNRGVLYEQMIKAQSISIYVPAGIKVLRLELLVVTA